MCWLENKKDGFCEVGEQSRTKHAALTLAPEEHEVLRGPSPDGRGEEEGVQET